MIGGEVDRVVGELGGLDVLVNCAGGGDLWRALPENTVDELAEGVAPHV